MADAPGSPSSESRKTTTSTEESPQSSPERQPTSTTNPSLNDDDVADAELLSLVRGDAVGDTLYSQRFILRTLMTLSKKELEKKERTQLENDLCSVWDMTVEQDVAKFLLKEEFLAVFLHVVDSTEDLRLIEILVGMLGNVCCHDCGFQALTNDLSVVEILLKLMTCMDAPILIQLMRLLETAMAKLKSVKSNEAKLWYRYFGSIDELAHKFAFILKMCKVRDVLTGCMKALNAILAKCALIDEERVKLHINDTEEQNLSKFVDIFLNGELVEGTNMAFIYLMESRLPIEGDSDNDCDSKGDYDLKKATTNETLEIYMNIHTILSQYEESIFVYSEHIDDVLECLSIILSQYADEPNLIPLSEQTVLCLESVVHISSCLDHPFKANVFVYAFKIWYLLKMQLHTLNGQTEPVNEFESDDNDSLTSTKPYINNIKLVLDFLAAILSNSTLEALCPAFDSLLRSEIDYLLEALDAVENNIFSKAACNIREAITIPATQTTSVV